MLAMYSIEPIDLAPQRIAECAQLLRLVFPQANQFTKEYLEWQYNLNPVGKVVGFNAWNEGQLVAHYVALPIVSLIQGKKTKGLLSVNSATHPEHRGKKLFTNLADATCQRGKELGYEFVIGVANASSTPGFIRKLGFILLSPLEVKLGLGKIKQATSHETYTYERMWSKEFLDWRLKNPSQKYSIKIDDDKFVVEAATGRYGIKAIIGVFDRDLLPEIKTSKINTLNPLKLWMGADRSTDWRNSFYFDVPKKFRSSPLNLVFKDLRCGIELNSTNIKFQSIDFDAY
jgi:predicted N-acetyltransferase YhbS